MSVDSYERTPYLSMPYDVASPARLATIAHLFGMKPADPRRARVLEIGCAGGGHLLPLAAENPGSSYVGIDPAGEHVRAAARVIAELGLGNARVERRGIEDLDPAEGPYDYIVAHGVFSWVPAAIRETMLARCAELLAPHGVAYISYNTLPGWYMRGMIRDAMLFHTEGVEDPAERAGRARAMLDFLADQVPRIANAWGEVIASERATLQHHGDSYLLHDHLSEVNQPLYVRDFIAMSREAGLEYLGEAELSDMLTVDLPPRARRAVESFADDIVKTQQYLDFLVNRTFRHSLLVRSGVALERTLRWDRVRDLWLASPLRRNTEAPLSLKPDLPATFSAGVRELQTDDPSLKAAWAELQARFPEPIAFGAWVEAAAGRLRGAGLPVPDDLEPHLGRAALHAVARSLVELWPHPMPLGGARAERPAGAPMAVLQAREGFPWGATNRRHEVIALNPFDRALLALCDGTRDRHALESALVDSVIRGDLVFEPEDGQSAPLAVARSEIRRDVPARLAWLDRRALLAPPPLEA